MLKASLNLRKVKPSTDRGLSERKDGQIRIREDPPILIEQLM